MKKVLTIVVPAYNVEKYLKNCLDSFVDVNILNSIEILVVDDGSTDKTADIAKNYEKKYPNSFRLLSKENGGHGSTINYAIPRASGKYFKVVDGDDWVDKKHLPAFCFSKPHPREYPQSFRKIYPGFQNSAPCLFFQFVRLQKSCSRCKANL